jgi:hypothetical protein
MDLDLLQWAQVPATGAAVTLPASMAWTTDPAEGRRFGPNASIVQGLATAVAEGSARIVMAYVGPAEFTPVFSPDFNSTCTVNVDRTAVDGGAADAGFTADSGQPGGVGVKFTARLLCNGENIAGAFVDVWETAYSVGNHYCSGNTGADGRFECATMIPAGTAIEVLDTPLTGPCSGYGTTSKVTIADQGGGEMVWTRNITP